MIVLQKLRKLESSNFDIAVKYYSLISVVNNLGLTEREIQLVAFVSVKGNISNDNVREEFVKKFNTSKPTINNIISKLKKLNIFVKENGKVKVNPLIVVDFTKDIVLQISISHEK